MFDNIGQGPDPDELKRGGLALALSVLLGGVIAGGTFVYLSLRIFAPELITPPDEDMTAIEIIEEVAAEAPPPPPPPPAAAATVEEEEEEVEKTPDEVQEEVKELKEEIKEEIKDDKVTGSPDGVPGGVDGGVPGGVPGGQPGGVVGGTPGGTGTSLTTSRAESVDWKTRFQDFEYPEAAKQARLGDTVSCPAVVILDETGRPESVEFKPGCPTLFHDEAKSGLLKWRAYPTKPPAKRKVLFNLKFTLRK